MATRIQECYETSLRAIDTGFCVKKHKMSVKLPVSTQYKIYYDDENGEKSVAIGNYDFVRFYLTVAGYDIVPLAGM